MSRPQIYDSLHQLVPQVARRPVRFWAGLAGALTVLLMASMVACSSPSSDSALPEAKGAGSPSASASASSSMDPKDAMLKYAQCMRDNGVDMSDPSGEGGITVKTESEKQMRAAEKACDSLRQQAMPKEGARELSAKDKQAMLDMAKCMRDKGHDFPDPTFDKGRVTQRRAEKGSTGGGAGPNAQEEKDMAACGKNAGFQPMQRTQKK